MSKLTKEEQEVIQSRIALVEAILDTNRKEASRFTSLLQQNQKLTGAQSAYLQDLTDEIARQEDEKERLEEQLEEAKQPALPFLYDLIMGIETGRIDANTLEYYSEYEWEEVPVYTITQKDEYNTVLYSGKADSLVEELLEGHLKITPRKW